MPPAHVVDRVERRVETGQGKGALVDVAGQHLADVAGRVERLDARARAHVQGCVHRPPDGQVEGDAGRRVDAQHDVGGRIEALEVVGGHTQISAVTKALQAVALELLDDHLSHCVADAVAGGGEDAPDKIAEASAAIARLVRS